MRKSYFFVLLGLIASTIACNKADSESESDEKPYGIVSKVNMIYMEGSEIEDDFDVCMEYDQHNNITKISYLWSPDDGYILNYKKEGNKLTVTDINVEHPDNVDAIFKANLDVKGQIVTAEHSYDKEGHGDLTFQNFKCQYYDNGDLKLCINDYYETECKFTWDDGNIVKNEYSSMDGVFYRTAVGKQYSSPYENRTNIVYADLFISDIEGILSPDALTNLNLRSAGYLGNMDKYLPAKIVWTEDDDSQSSMIIEYTYEFNADDLPTTIIAKFNREEERLVIIMKVTYKK